MAKMVGMNKNYREVAGVLATFENGSALTTIVSSAFGGCSKLSPLTLPASVTRIGASAFYNCSSLTAVIINSTNITFDENDFAFKNCSALTYLRLKAKYADVTNKDKIVTDCPNLMGIIYENYATSLKTTTINPYEVRDDYYSCDYIHYENDPYFVLPDKAENSGGKMIDLTTIQNHSFVGVSFEVLDISYITSIYTNQAIYNNNNLRIIVLGEGVTFGENNVIYNNPNLEYIVFKGTKSSWNNKISYYNNIFYNCPNLKAIICTDGEILLTNPE